VPALVIEDRRGREALKRSWNLVKGRSWPVFGTIIVVGIGTSLLSGLLTELFGDSVLAQAAGSAIASIVTTPYLALVSVLIYLDVRVRKERYSPGDLVAELARARAV
jgi:fucose permease